MASTVKLHAQERSANRIFGAGSGLLAQSAAAPRAPFHILLPKAPAGTLENPLRRDICIPQTDTARKAGYTGVEFYGMHFQAEFYPALLRETGLVCAGWHMPIEALEDDFESVLRRNLLLGNRYVCVPWFNAPTADEWKKFADRLNAIAEKLAPYGIRTGYHNHAHEFQPVDGLLPWDIVAENTLPQVILQLDTGNAASGGADVPAVLEKYPGRSQSIHFKPYSAAEKFAPAIGADDLPWEKILDFCEKRGNTEWIVVEYEEKNDPEKGVAQSLAALHKLRPRG